MKNNENNLQRFGQFILLLLLVIIIINIIIIIIIIIFLSFLFSILLISFCHLYFWLKMTKCYESYINECRDTEIYFPQNVFSVLYS